MFRRPAEIFRPVRQTAGAAGFYLVAVLAIFAFGEAGAMEIRSASFDHLEEIPSRHTCQGDDVSPPLAWTGIPEGTRSLVLIIDDPDAPDPDAPQMTWVHWVLFNLPPDIDGLGEGVAAEDLPNGTGEGLNDWKRTGYGGPCPPVGRHRYFHKLYALGMRLENLVRPTKADIERAMRNHVLEKAELVGTYQKR